MNPTERRLVVLGIGAAITAVVASLIEPRLAAPMLGALSVALLIGVSVWSLDRLGRRLPQFGAAEPPGRPTIRARELPEDISYVTAMMRDARGDEPLPGAVGVRVREITAAALIRTHRVALDSDAGRAMLREIASPTLYAAATGDGTMPTLRNLPELLDELERL